MKVKGKIIYYAVQIILIRTLKRFIVNLLPNNETFKA